MPNSMLPEAEELLSTVDISKMITHLKLNVQSTLDKLKEFSKREGRRKISELNELMDTTELNDFLRIVFNGGHPTIDSNEEIRRFDYLIEKCKTTGSKTIKATEEKGLSFCTSLSQFVEVAKLKIKSAKTKIQEIHIYKINENTKLPHGLAFIKDHPGHVSLVATHDMPWNEMINKLKIVSDILEHFTTIKVEL